MFEIDSNLFSFIWKYSKREQLFLLVVTVLMFPILYFSLELPKRIVNDVIGAETATVTIWNFTIEKTEALYVLCGLYLFTVLGHGLLKMRINTMKGILAERMLRRFRYQLISRMLLFPQPYFERVSQGELVSMITSESEPMGGLMGDMISQPVMQAGQMITILWFLFAQSFWFGLAAVALIPLQAWLIPMLQRQINKLNKERIKEVRVLAAVIGESAAGVSALRLNGGWRYRLSLVTAQLGRLFEIRFKIYNKKFFMKFLNNFIGQLTPFFFYLVGGYLVLQGTVSLGALVAALGAYKDISSPWKELLTYYNQTADMQVRWETVTERFAPAGMMNESLFDGEPEDLPHLKGDIVLDHVTLRDADGNPVLEDISTTLPGGKVIAIAAPSEEDRRAFTELLTREVVPTSGRIEMSGQDLAMMHHAVIASRIGRATSRPLTFQGTFGENVLMPLRYRPLDVDQSSAQLAEAIRAGNSSDPLEVSWLDPSRAEFESIEEMRDWWHRLIEGIGSGTALFQRGLDQVFEADAHPILAEKVVGLRTRARAAVEEAGLRRYVYFFDPELYNPALPVAENLLFATPRRPLTQEALVQQTEFLALLREIQLDEPLVALTREVIDMLRQIFGPVGTDHPLFRNLGLDAESYGTAVGLVERAREGGAAALTLEELAQLLIVPFKISAEQIGPAFSDGMKAQILELRQSHAADLQRTMGDLFVPIDPHTYAPGITVLENALFGKISHSAGSRGEEVERKVAQVIVEGGAEENVIDLIYEMEISIGGTNLPAIFAEPLSLSRAAIKRPDILILDRALASYDMATQVKVHRNLRRLLPDTTLIYLNDSFEDPDNFDVYFEIRQGRIVSDEAVEEMAEDSASTADLMRKVRALENIPLFSGLNRKQVRLLAFGSHWYQAQTGEIVFEKGDEPRDGAYVLIEGEAGLYLPKPEGEDDQLIARVGPGALVGELGLIKKEPRALTMVAETDLQCLRLGEQEFLAVVENDAATAFKILQVVAGYVSN
ncbi:ABC transporter transmembrane domain-containing protein [Chachezhania sediminis]|uniref:ABC transporter transmembrane domain-containing protein n=1 Tax=Chachezhania sediminis TaxID=2599291 RepID=UPI00131CC09D|nr:ABC transporter transmembrane domain-containing protein [Chachezhania sediminis]